MRIENILETITLDGESPVSDFAYLQTPKIELINFIDYRKIKQYK